MKRALLILISVINFYVLVKPQDVITLKNGTEIYSFVKIIDDVNITYKKFDNPNGPNYVLKKSEIALILYANGSKDVFEGIAESKEPDYESVLRPDVPNNDNPSTNANYILKISDKIVVRVYGLRLSTKHMRKSLEEKLREVGFCCVYRSVDESVLSMDIVVHPDGFSSIKFRIFDKSLEEGEVFAASYRKKYVDNFIKDITPFIER